MPALALTALLAACVVGVVAVHAAPPPPAQLLNLTTWDLQLPVSNGNGGVVTIPAKALQNYSSQYFYTNETDMTPTFWCPIDGARTSGSPYPRSELRQRPDFTFAGTHVMNVTMAVLVVPPSGSKRITIGQIHTSGSGGCSIISEFEYAAGGKLVNNVRTADCTGVQYTVGTAVPLGERFSFSLSLVGTTLRVWTSVGNLADYQLPWMSTNVSVYFKTGSYVLHAGNSSVEGGSVAIMALSTIHTDE